jgi:hypothetical protein
MCGSVVKESIICDECVPQVPKILDWLKVQVGELEDILNSIKNPRLSLILTCQTDIAREIMNSKTFRAKGLPARFLCALCHQSDEIQYGDTPDIPPTVKAEYNSLIRRLLDYALNRESPAYEIGLSEDGYATYLKCDYGNKLKFALGGDYAHMRDWGNKVIGKMLRIAGIIAVCEGKIIY